MSVVLEFGRATWDAAVQHVAWVALLAIVLGAFDLVLARCRATRCRSALSWAFLAKLVIPPAILAPAGLAPLVEADFVARAVPAVGTASWVTVLVAYVIGAAVMAALVVRRARADRRAWLEAGTAPLPGDVARRVARLARSLGLARPPRVLVSRAGFGPAVLGTRRPVVVVPSDLLKRDACERLEHVLLHELAHVRRRDHLGAAAWAAVTCLYWFHPAVWFAARRAELLRELGSDELAARSARDGARAYRRTLLELARPLVAGVPRAPAFGRAQVLARLALLEFPPRRDPRASAAGAALLFVLVCACCLPLGRSPSFARPGLDDVEGCLRKRYLVLAAIAEEDASRAATQPP